MVQSEHELSERGLCMRNIELLMASLEYIECHLCDDLKTEDIAAACFCSRSTLEKLFRGVHHITVREYIIRRRMMLAAKRLSEAPETSILDVALEHGYSTHESFARAFERVWNCKPSEFRRAKFVELFPRLSVPVRKGAKQRMRIQSIEVTELYDLLTERKNCWFIACDIRHMTDINRISRKAGDLAILEQMRRLTAMSGEEDIVFRIGGDEFCILTASEEKSHAEAVAEKIRALNGQTFAYREQQIPLSLYSAVVSVAESRRADVFEDLQSALCHAARNFEPPTSAS